MLHTEDSRIRCPCHTFISLCINLTQRYLDKVCFMPTQVLPQHCSAGNWEDQELAGRSAEVQFWFLHHIQKLPSKLWCQLLQEPQLFPRNTCVMSWELQQAQRSQPRSAAPANLIHSDLGNTSALRLWRKLCFCQMNDIMKPVTRQTTFKQILVCHVTSISCFILFSVLSSLFYTTLTYFA